MQNFNYKVFYVNIPKLEGLVLKLNHLSTRVARWFNFIPKIPKWLNLGVPWNVKCWYIIWPYGAFYGQLMASWNILW
jgi:hypothetical protein